MHRILQTITALGATPIVDEKIVIPLSEGGVKRFVAINPSSFNVVVEEGAAAQLVVVTDSDEESTVNINLYNGANVEIVELICGGGVKRNININQQEGSELNALVVSLFESSTSINVSLNGVNAHSEVNTLQMGSCDDSSSLHLNMRHISPDCSSNSLSKCIASGKSTLSFEALVYVAHDAQRTSAQQNCRSIELSDTSHIVARPQLEIYADDVKCSHGATMGQVDTEAIFYMRQRGLSEAQARRVQIEGFVADVVNRCTTEELCECLKEYVGEKLEKM